MRASEDLMARSAKDLAMAQPVIAQPTLDLPMDQAASIDNDIDQITAQLAAFFFEQLERSVTSHDGLDLNTDASILEDEFWVSYNCILLYVAMRANQYTVILYIQCTVSPFRSFQQSPRMCSDLLQIL